jgi:hypothetical protein
VATTARILLLVAMELAIAPPREHPVTDNADPRSVMRPQARMQTQRKIVSSAAHHAQTKSPQIGTLVDQSTGGELRRTSAAWVTHKSARNCWPRVS